MANDRQLVISDHFPYVPLEAEIAGRTWRGEALVDTGFDGDLILPNDALPDQPAEFGLPWRFADNSLVMTPGYRGMLRLGSHPAVELNVTVAFLGDEAILGIGVVRQFAVTLDSGRRVTLASPSVLQG